MAESVELREAVAGLVNDGDTVALEGFSHLIPFAAAREVMRQKKRGLTLVRMTPDLVYDQMIGMNTASKLIFSWVATLAWGASTASATPWSTAGPPRWR
jgi:glutaconate CoA-transferase, subunit A